MLVETSDVLAEDSVAPVDPLCRESKIGEVA